MRTNLVLAAGFLVFGTANSLAQTPDFEAQVRPLLRERCVSCHGAKVHKSSLRLDAKSFAFQGGDSGPAIVPGKRGESELYLRITSDDEDEHMPPKAPALSAEETALIGRWIDAGAPWLETGEDRAAARDARLDHWAWQPIQTPKVPSPKDAQWVRNPIDAFVRSRLERANLTPSPEADRRTLIRRLAFDLLGLPPSPEEVDAFLLDPDPRAYEALVERYLASPHYGERWARHWLDVAHYADTHGFERDQRRDNAWRYRDYVIQALNSDKPYPDFLREQIAGDAIRPNDPQAVTATGFLAAGPWDFVGQVETKNEELRRAARADDLDDMVTQVLTASCGVTINCARCHDHKLDPIAQREYYALWAVFAGVKRADRPIDASAMKQVDAQRKTLQDELRQARTTLNRSSGGHIDLADIVGGGDGFGSGTRGAGIDVLTGHRQVANRGFLTGIKPNTYVRSEVPAIDGVVVPNASPEGTPISSTGLRVTDVPATSGQTWDAIRNGPVNAQFSTKLGGLDFAATGHTLLSLHANAAITFDLAPLRPPGPPVAWKFTTAVGYFGQTPTGGARFQVYLDGLPTTQHAAIGRNDGLIPLAIRVPASARFLTLMATDNGNGIGHDQVGFTDPWLQPADSPVPSAKDQQEHAKLKARISEIEAQLRGVADPAKVFAVESSAPAVVKLLRRGNPETPGEEVSPGTIGCLRLPTSLGDRATEEGERRRALAEWITDLRNPLTRRVIVNRVWHYHFGTGIVDTPSDFGLGGGRPSHPELLDWLAEELVTQNWSLKAMHRVICTSATYRQSSRPRTDAHRVDADNRLLWRMSPRRLDAETLRDAVLAVSGTLNTTAFGPGYRDFRYTEAYAPIYEYITPDSPDLWRRSIYRFVVRTTTHQFLTTLDCPNPANLTPARNVTTTSLQSLALLNNAFMLRQAGYFADRLHAEGGGSPPREIDRAFALAFAREPRPEERAAALQLVEKSGLKQFCRMLLNANEFIYGD